MLNSCLFIQGSTILSNGESKQIFSRSSKTEHSCKIPASLPLTSEEQQPLSLTSQANLPSFKPGQNQQERG